MACKYKGNFCLRTDVESPELIQRQCDGEESKDCLRYQEITRNFDAFLRKNNLELREK